MSPVREVLRDSSGDSGSESDNASASSRSSRSGSPTSQAPVQTSGNVRSEQNSEDENGARSLASNASGRSSRSSSRTIESNKLDDSRKSESRSPARSGSRRSSVGSVQSEKSGSQRSRSASPKSVASNSSDSQKSPRSRSPSSRRSVHSSSPKSPVSPRSTHSESRSRGRKSKTPASPTSNGSGYDSPKRRRSGSISSQRSNKSVGSASQNSPAERQSKSSLSPKDTKSFDESAKRASSEKLDSKGSKSNSPKDEKSDNESNRSFKQTDNNQCSKIDWHSKEEQSQFKRKNAVSDTEKSVKRFKAIINSDSDNETVDQENNIAPTADALFGDASDISTDDEKDKKEEKERERSRSVSRSRSKSHSRSRSRSRSRSHSRGRSESGGEGPSRTVIEDEEEKDKEEEPEPPPETRIDVEIPKITTDLGREIHFVKLPNFLSVETRPFDHETYEDEIDEEETLDEEGRARLKLKVENTLRWKETFSDEGKVVKESNARFVKWSDGSMSLHLGSEIFDVYKQPLQGDHNHLYIRQGTGLQGQAVFRTKLTFRPHSTESFTHRKMTMSLADRSQKTSGIKVLSQVGMNPDQNRYEMIKKEEEKLRMAMRVQSKTKKSTGSIRNTARAAGAYSNNDTYHDDGSDDEGAISLAAIKNKYKKGAAAIPAKASSNIYSSDEEGSDFETLRPKKNIKGKVLKDSDEESNSASSSGSGADDNRADNASD